MDFSLILNGFLLSIPVVLIAWLISVHQRNVGLVDIFWSLFFIIAVTSYLSPSTMLSTRAYLVFILVFVWAFRLAAYLAWRNLGKPEDRRYVEIRDRNQPGFEWKSLYLVFLFQLILATIISTPLHAAMQSTNPLASLDKIAVVIWIIGFFWETIADFQLAKFKSISFNQGKVMRKGLWKYCRHPNYFGESLVWIAYGLFSVASNHWWPLISVFIMILLLLKYTGVGLLEKNIVDRHPNYRNYIESTNAFIPWFPKTQKTE